jgi:hypothetical protein
VGAPALADRRTFIRQLSGDAVASAGRIAGFSTAFRRTMLAAGVAATRELESPPSTLPPAVEPAIGDPASADPPDGDPSDAPPSMPTVASLPSAASIPPGGLSGDDVVAALTPDQHDFLTRGTRAVFAVNDPKGAPHLSASPCHWDGEILRLPSQMFAARAAHVDRDPRVTIFIEDRSSGAWVTVTGMASIVYGEAVETEVATVIGHDQGGAAAVDWAELRTIGDAVVIRVRPSRFLWRPA